MGWQRSLRLRSRGSEAISDFEGFHLSWYTTGVEEVVLKNILSLYSATGNGLNVAISRRLRLRRNGRNSSLN